MTGIFVEVDGTIINAYKIRRVEKYNPRDNHFRVVQIDITTCHDIKHYPAFREALLKVQAPVNIPDLCDEAYRR